MKDQPVTSPRRAASLRATDSTEWTRPIVCTDGTVIRFREGCLDVGMTGPGRPSTGTRVDVRIPDEQIDQLDRWSAANKTTRAVAIRTAITHALEGDTMTIDDVGVAGVDFI